ncbi:MAG: ribosomal L7Ae/L30e/S12e/Gadd45 family protein [Candidatus Woesearchaeota archaeon]
MARKETDIKKELQLLMSTKKAVIGTDRAIKGIKLGTIKKVYVSSNCPERTRKSLQYYCSIGKVACEELGFASTDLGVICKKPFSISVLSAKNE